MEPYETLAQEVIARGNVALTEDEVKVLEAAPDSHLISKKLLGAHYFNVGMGADAIRCIRHVYSAARTPENASNLVSALSKAGAIEDAIAIAEEEDTPLLPVTQASYLSELYGRAKKPGKNRHWARRALKLKEGEAPELEDRAAPIVRPFNPETPERNIIAFSLFGDGKRYLEGAIRNCIVARYMYPGWTPRFYVDDSVPVEARNGLTAAGAQLKMVPNLPALRFGLYWRFLVEDDPEVDVYIVRDADSIPTIKERVAVQDWLASGEPFHVMRDWVTHTELVLAGMWGAHRGNITGGMGRKILDFSKTRENILNSRVDDQLFLRREIWPYMRGRTFVQDSHFGYGESALFNPDYLMPGEMHIGQNDLAVRDNDRKKKAVAAHNAKVKAAKDKAAKPTAKAQAKPAKAKRKVTVKKSK
ncbi:MAG: hypothetical protein ACRBCL_03310 [Maritimibacter sp.]